MSKVVGRWRIKWMEMWDQDFVDLVEPGYFQFDEDGLGFLYSEQLRAKLTTAFLMVEDESSFLGLEMMMVARNPAVVGFSFYLHAQRKGNSSFIVETSRP